MGNRASVVFYDTEGVSPTVYLHWHGVNVPAWLERLKHNMNGPFDDAECAAARFVGFCNLHIQSNLGLAVSSNTLTLADIHDESRMEDESPGDAGMVVVNTRDFGWKAYGGYLADAGRA